MNAKKELENALRKAVTEAVVADVDHGIIIGIIEEVKLCYFHARMEALLQSQKQEQQQQKPENQKDSNEQTPS